MYRSFNLRCDCVWSREWVSGKIFVCLKYVNCYHGIVFMCVIYLRPIWNTHDNARCTWLVIYNICIETYSVGFFFQKNRKTSRFTVPYYLYTMSPLFSTMKPLPTINFQTKTYVRNSINRWRFWCWTILIFVNPSTGYACFWICRFMCRGRGVGVCIVNIPSVFHLNHTLKSGISRQRVDENYKFQHQHFF